MVVQCIVKMIAHIHLWKLSLQKLMLKIAYPQKVNNLQNFPQYEIIYNYIIKILLIIIVNMRADPNIQ